MGHALLAARDLRQPYDAASLAHHISGSVRDVARRLGGLQPIGTPFGFQGQTRDRLQFPAVYAEMKAMYAARPDRRTRALAR